jgi:hypothetical protein
MPPVASPRVVDRSVFSLDLVLNLVVHAAWVVVQLVVVACRCCPQMVVLSGWGCSELGSLFFLLVTSMYPLAVVAPLAVCTSAWKILNERRY